MKGGPENYNMARVRLSSCCGQADPVYIFSFTHGCCTYHKGQDKYSVQTSNKLQRYNNMSVL